MATAKTWLWIIGSVALLGVLGLVLAAGAGLYFVSKHIEMQTATGADAMRELDAARERFESTPPLIEIDALDRSHQRRDVRSLPTSPVKPASLHVLAWDPEDDRLARISLPFWMLRLGRQNMKVLDEAGDFDFEELNLDVDQLERIGPTLILDHRSSSGERVVVWTQ